MVDVADFVMSAFLVGVAATAVMDLCALALKWIGGVPLSNYGFVGRWMVYLARGRFFHDPIAASPPVQGEVAIGWAVHYLVGIAYACLLLGIWGLGWTRQPTIGPALIVGIGTIVVPFFVMQPGMGAGIAASRTPNPAAARVRSLFSHTSFAVGLYVGGWIAHKLTS